MRFKSLIINILFVAHTLIVLAFFIPFFIPSSVWPSRIEWHFYYVMMIFILFYLTGLPWSIKDKQVYSICWITLVMQKLRGYDWWDKRNYRHSFTAELFELLHLGKYRKLISKFIVTGVVLAIVLFILKVNGIVFY